MDCGYPIKISELQTLKGCQLAIDRLLEMSPTQIAQNDITTLNLLCAPALPGSENLNIIKCLARLENVTAFVRDALVRNRSFLRGHPNFNCEARESMSLLVTKVKRDYGATYSPSAAADLAAGIKTPFHDAGEVLVHGLLSDDQCRRWGTCTSIPVLITAIARRLNFPVKLAVTRRHVFCRWDDGAGTCFNIEASNPQGMGIFPDDHYRMWPNKLTWKELQSGHFIRSLSPAEEFALFIKSRIYCMLDAAQYDDTLRWVARALQYAPDDPNFHKDAMVAVNMAMRHRHWKRFRNEKLPAYDAAKQPLFHVGRYLERTEMSSFLTIVAHHEEQEGQIEQSRKDYEDACRYSMHGFNEHRDYQRFLKKHSFLKPKPRPLLWPRDLCVTRFFRISCQPGENAAETLRRAADTFERQGELIKAHDALRDLYMFDPSDDQVFCRCRAIESNIWFRSQLETQLSDTRRMYKQLGKTFSKFSNRTTYSQLNGPVKLVKPYEGRERFTVRT